MMRWWDGTEWTETIRSDDAVDEPRVPVQEVVRNAPSHFPLVAGLLFLVAGVLAGTQLVYMNTAYSMNSFRVWQVGVPVTLPFDWYLLLFPYWVWTRSFFTWGLIPPVIVLLACSVCLFFFRHKTRTAMLTVAALLTVENLLLLVPIFIDSGSPGSTARPILMPSQFTSPDATAILAGVLIVHVLVWALPLIFAGASAGSARARRRLSIVFLAVAGAYFLWYLGSFLFAPVSSAYLLTPGPTQYAGSWLAPFSTAICLAAMCLLVLPYLRERRT